jgi:ribonuclease HI
VIIRDNQGWVFAALSKTIQISLDPTMAEAAAALLAVEFSRDSGLQHVILEGDSKNVVLALSETNANLSRYGQIIEDAKVVLRGFRSWEVRHVYRQANMAAQEAKLREYVQKITKNVLQQTPYMVS